MKRNWQAVWRAIKPVILLLAAWVLLFQLWRGVLVLATWSHHGEANGALLFQSFLTGLRFDLSMAVKLLLFFGLWKLWRSQPGQKERIIVGALWVLVVLMCVFTLTAEVEFYKEFGMRFNPVVFQFFSTNGENNRTILGMIWHGYPVVRWMTLCLAVWAIFAWLSGRVLLPRRTAEQWPARIVASALWIALVVIGWRGGFNGTPLRWGDAAFSQNTYANHMAENGVFALVDTVRNFSRWHKNIKRWEQAMPFADSVEIARKRIMLPGERLVDPERFPLLRISPPSQLPLQQRPENVVVVIMESFSARFCGAVGAKFGATPNFDRLANRGILFDRAFSVATHTAQGVYGTLCSFPSLPELDGLMKHPLGNQAFRSLPRVLNEAGLETLFLYNGQFSWDNKEGFFRKQGVRRFIGRDDYVQPKFVDPDWGVSDEDVFDRALVEFDELSQKKKRFLGVVLTLSNHAPFNLPKVPGLEAIQGGGEQNQRLNGVHYADWALGQFMEAAQRKEWFERTLFVFVGDHGFSVPPEVTPAALLHMHVPLLFYGPKILGDAPAVRHTVASQLDIEPTIIGIVGANLPHQSFGRDLFSLPANDPGYALVKRSGSSQPALITGHEVLVRTLGSPSTLHHYELSFPPTASPNVSAQEPAAAHDLANDLNAFVVTGLTMLERHLLSPQRHTSANAPNHEKSLSTRAEVH